MSNEMIAVCIGLTFASMIVSGVALTMACVCWSKVVGMEKSTHQVAWVPMENDKGKPIEGTELDEQMLQALGEKPHEKEYI